MLHRPFRTTQARCRPGRQDSRNGLFSAMKLPIKFGTDGWRAIIADTFTFENVRHAAQATAGYFNTVTGTERAVFIGYDGRFLSDRFARATAEVLAANGYRAVL